MKFISAEKLYCFSNFPVTSIQKHYKNKLNFPVRFSSPGRRYVSYTRTIIATHGTARRIPITPNIFPPTITPIKIHSPETPREFPNKRGLIIYPSVRKSVQDSSEQQQKRLTLHTTYCFPATIIKTAFAHPMITVLNNLFRNTHTLQTDSKELPVSVQSD